MQSTEKYQSNKQQDLQQAIQSGSECYQTCLATLSHCLSMGGEHANAPHIQAMYDCAEICQLAVSYMVRSSPMYGRLNLLCAEVCTRCANQCEQMMGDDEQMRTCAVTCRKCADICQKTTYADSALGTNL
jgi:Domain of Unknown Function (DUF326)